MTANKRLKQVYYLGHTATSQLNLMEEYLRVKILLVCNNSDYDFIYQL